MKVSFKNNNNGVFSNTLKKKVEEYFSTQPSVSETGNRRLYFKTAILLLTGLSVYLVLILAGPPFWVSIILCVLFGISLAAIGFNVMHDGAHGSYSQKKWINEIMAYSLNLMGGNTYLWKQKHNLNHHTYTNIEGHDDDIDIRPFMRTNNSQPRRWFHKYQHFYWIFLYGLGYISWVYGKNFREYFSGKIGNKKMRRMSLQEHFVFWISKFVYFGIFIIIPIFCVGFWQAVIGYAIMCFSCGFLLSVVFQLAHVVESTDFPLPDNDTHKIHKEWMLHQLATTANFSTRNQFISWFMGGLNFQVEHHLFPRISHVHYPAISKLVKETCSEFNIRYNEYRTFFGAFRSHIRHLKYVGSA